MKKMFVFLCLFLGITAVSKADSICTDWGKFNLCLPITTGVDAAFGYDFKGSRSQGLAETGFGSFSLTSTAKLVTKFGGITSVDGQGAPFAGIDYQLKNVDNPVSKILTLSPGVYGGRDFHTNQDFYGVKAAVQIIY